MSRETIRARVAEATEDQGHTEIGIEASALDLHDYAEQDIPALLAVADAAAAICFGDLRDDFEDGQDIVLRWTGNRSDWQALRAALAALEALP